MFRYKLYFALTHLEIIMDRWSNKTIQLYLSFIWNNIKQSWHKGFLLKLIFYDLQGALQKANTKISTSSIKIITWLESSSEF